MIPTSPVRSDGPGRASRQRTLPIRRPNLQDRSHPISGNAERMNQGRCPGPNRLWRARKHKKTNQHDVPFRDCDVRRSRKLDASAAPTRFHTIRREQFAALLPHQRLRELPRGRCGPWRCDLPGLRLHPPSPLIRADHPAARSNRSSSTATSRGRACRHLSPPPTRIGRMSTRQRRRSQIRVVWAIGHDRSVRIVTPTATSSRAGASQACDRQGGAHHG